MKEKILQILGSVAAIFMSNPKPGTQQEMPTADLIKYAGNILQDYPSCASCEAWHKRELRNAIHAGEMLWIVVANVSNGDWSKQSKEWQEAAARWRDNWLSTINTDHGVNQSPE